MQWWRVFSKRRKAAADAAAAEAAEAEAVGPRRRMETRYGYETRLTARCSSWPRFVELFTGDVSRSGLFVPTTQAAKVGERVQVDLQLPDGSSVALGGEVVNVISDEVAARAGRRGGLGIKLDEPTPETRARFNQLVEAAVAAQPRPEVSTLIAPLGGAEPAPVKPPPAPQSLRTTAPVPSINTGSYPIPTPPAPTPPAPTPPAPTPPAPTPPALPPPAPKAPASPQTSAAPRPPPPAPAPRPAEPDDPIIGIDLGTTYTSAAAVRGNKVVILPRADGGHSTPSVIAFPTRDEIIVGPRARERIATDPAHTVISPKRLLGRAYSEREVQTFVGQAPYRTSAGPDGTTVIEIWQTPYAMPQLVSYLFADIRETAERTLGCRVSRAVVSVPITFEDARIESLRRAAQMAGLEIVSIVDEPSAAALANRYDKSFGGIVGVYDFGGGTFDFSVVDVSHGDFRVLATAGDTWLGGDDFDAVLAEAAANQFWRQHKVDLRKQAVEWQKLLFACERAKRTLTNAESAVISVPNVLRTAQGMIDLTLAIDRPTLARASTAVTQRSIECCMQALELIDMKPTDLSTIYLSGGTTYVHAVRTSVKEAFGVPVRTGVPPEHAVCLGAAIHAAQLQFRRAPTLEGRT